MIASAIILGTLIDIGAGAIEHHVAVKTAARKSTVEVVAIMLATSARALVIIEAGALVRTERVAEFADALVRAQRVCAVLAAPAVGECALIHVLAMSPIRQVEAHAAVARMVAGVVGTILRATAVVDGAFVNVLASMHILRQRETFTATATIADPPDDFAEVVAGSSAARVRRKGRCGNDRLPGQEDSRYRHCSHKSHRL
jgi:hypothetical protein